MRQFKAGRNRGDAIARLRRQLVAVVNAWCDTGKALPLPLAGVPIFAAFADLSRARRWSEVGPDPLQWSEIAAWAARPGRHLPPHHLDMIRALDAAWLEGQRKPQGEAVAGPLTAAAFDAAIG